MLHLNCYCFYFCIVDLYGVRIQYCTKRCFLSATINHLCESNRIEAHCHDFFILVSYVLSKFFPLNFNQKSWKNSAYLTFSNINYEGKKEPRLYFYFIFHLCFRKHANQSSNYETDAMSTGFTDAEII